MCLPSFEDRYPQFDGVNYYKVTNEEPEIHSALLGGAQFERAAGISSGGEVIFFSVMPRSNSVVAVDHAYKALVVAYLKATLLHNLGARGILSLWENGSYEAVKKAVAEAVPMMPEALATRVDMSYSDTWSNSISKDDVRYFHREWSRISEDVLEKVRQKLNSLTFIHGDLTDLSAFGEFDMLYVSNAMEHSDRSGKHPDALKLLPIVKEGGLILGTGDMYSPTIKEWQTVKSLRGKRTTWYHRLHKRTTIAPTPAVALELVTA